jgi:hypothetical protein
MNKWVASNRVPRRKHTSSWRRARTAFLILLAAFSGTAYAAVSTSDLFFSTSGQNIWDGGSASLVPYDKFLGLTWGDPYPQDYYKYYDLDPVGDVWGATSGKIGAEMTVSATTGNMSLRYPVQVDLTYPDTNTLYAGATFTIGSSYNVLPNGFDLTKYILDANNQLVPIALSSGAPVLQTIGPSIYASLDAILNVKAQVSGSLFGVSLPIIGPDIQQTYNLLKVDPNQGANIDLIPNILSGWAQAPDLNSQSSGVVGDALVSSARDGLAGLKLDVANLIGEVFGVPLNSSIGGVLDYNLLSAGIGLGVDLQQAFDFAPQPSVHLDFTSPVDVYSNGAWQKGLTAVDFLAGDAVTLRASNAYDLGIRPSIELGNTVTNNTDAILAGRLDMSALGLAVPDIGFSVGPLIHPNPVKFDLATLDLYDNQFELNTGAALNANVFNIGFKNRYNEVPVGGSLVNYCSLNPSALGCSDISVQDLLALAPCILDPAAAGDCARFNFRVRPPQDTCGSESQYCFPGLPELYLVNADCVAEDPTGCTFNQLIASLGDAIWDDALKKWDFVTSAFGSTDSVSLGAGSTDEQLLQRFAALGYDPADYQIVMRNSAVPEPGTALLELEGIISLGLAWCRSIGTAAARPKVVTA